MTLNKDELWEEKGRQIFLGREAAPYRREGDSKLSVTLTSLARYLNTQFMSPSDS